MLYKERQDVNIEMEIFINTNIYALELILPVLCHFQFANGYWEEYIKLYKSDESHC